jgi:hypothetical protein
VPSDQQPFASIESSLKKAVAAFERHKVPYLLGGSLAAWAQGGPESRKDLDFMIRPEDTDRALDALVDVGMRPERPPEQWLVKAWDGGVLIDLIHEPQGLPITDEVIERGRVHNVLGVNVRIMALEDVMVTKLLALDEHSLDYESLLQISRSVREKVDWAEVRTRTEGSPYAKAFFTLIEALGVVGHPVGDQKRDKHVRVRAV